METHELKTWPEYFQEVKAGRKTFEIRREDDRCFNVADQLVLREFVPCPECDGKGFRDYGDHGAPCGCPSPHGAYTGDSLRAVITYRTDFGQPKGQVVLAIGLM